jgi:hypothetical protein
VTDVIEMLAAYKLDVSDEPVPPVGDVWRKLNHTPPKHARQLRLRRPAVFGGAASAIAAATLAIVLLSAGGAPSVAQAFPILASTQTEVAHAGGGIHGGPGIAWALLTGALPAEYGRSGSSDNVQISHQFAAGSDTGYVLQTTYGSWICVTANANAGPGPAVVGCSTTTDAEKQGIVVVFRNGEGFIALVPTGGSVSLTTNGTTTSVPVDSDGIATDSVRQNATLSVQVGGSVYTQQLGPGLGHGLYPASGSTSSTGPTGASGATGASASN